MRQNSLASAFRRGRNAASHESEANTEVQRDLPTSPNSRAYHRTSGRTESRLNKTEARSQREMPSASTLNIPRMCFASKGHPEDSPSTPRRRISAPDHGSFPPRNTAASTALRLRCPHAAKHNRPSQTSVPRTKKPKPTPERPWRKARER